MYWTRASLAFSSRWPAPQYVLKRSLQGAPFVVAQFGLHLLRARDHGPGWFPVLVRGDPDDAFQRPRVRLLAVDPPPALLVPLALGDVLDRTHVPRTALAGPGHVGLPERVDHLAVGANRPNLERAAIGVLERPRQLFVEALAIRGVHVLSDRLEPGIGPAGLVAEDLVDPR